jgi:hypothetical protein
MADQQFYLGSPKALELSVDGIEIGEKEDSVYQLSELKEICEEEDASEDQNNEDFESVINLCYYHQEDTIFIFSLLGLHIKYPFLFISNLLQI